MNKKTIKLIEDYDNTPELTYAEEVSNQKDSMSRKFTKWEVSDNNTFYPSYDIEFKQKLHSGYYQIRYDDRRGSFYLKKLEYSIDNIFELPIPEIKEILNDIKTFWKKENKFNEYGYIHKRGCLIYGPAGNGKSCCIQLIIKDLIENQNGVIFKISNITDLEHYLTFVGDTFKSIEPTTKIVTIIEDIEGLCERGTEAETLLLNVLDGMEQLKNVVYVATTNYPEKLKERITNRPSRFDRRYRIDQPNDEVREYYIKKMLKEKDLNNIDLNKWVKDTESLSLSHIRELVVSTILMGNDYEKVIKYLKDMSEDVSSDDFNKNGKVKSSMGY